MLNHGCGNELQSGHAARKVPLLRTAGPVCLQSIGQFHSQASFTVQGSAPAPSEGPASILSSSLQCPPTWVHPTKAKLWGLGVRRTGKGQQAGCCGCRDTVGPTMTANT